MGRLVVGVNDLYTWCSENGEYGQQLIQEWTGLDEFGNIIYIEGITRKNSKKVRWKCKEGHIWTAKIANRTYQNQGCPYCSGQKVSNKNSLLSWCQTNKALGQQLLEEWTGLDENDNPMNINELARASGKKVQWKCSKGHTWIARIADRTTKNLGCPYCSGQRVSDKNSLKTWCQEHGAFGQQLLQEWVGLDENNNKIEINEISYGSKKKVQWKCNKGHQWSATILSRTNQKLGCPYCNPKGTSFPEQFIYHSLRQIYTNTITRGRYKGYEYDITIPELKLCIEYSGIQWHKDKLYTRDEEKKQLCKEHRVNFLQIYAHHGEIQDTEGNIANDSYTKKQIIYRVNNNKDLHIAQLQIIVKFILEQYDPKHNITEINFDKSELEANKIIRGINDMELGGGKHQ